MGELKQMMERAGFESFMEYLIYGAETDHIPVRDEGKDTYQKRIDAAFEELFDRMKCIFPSSGRDRDDLYSAVLDFSIVHQETYTVMGFLAGLRFYADLQKACYSKGGDKIQSVVKRIGTEGDGTAIVEMNDGSLFEIRFRKEV